MRRPPHTFLITLACLMAVGCGEREPSEPVAEDPPPRASTGIDPPHTTSTTAADDRLGAIVRSLPLTEQAGQLVMTKLSAPQLTEDERDALRRGRIGGVIIFDFGYEGPEQLEALASEVQAVGTSASSARLGVLVAADQEGGAVRAFDDLPPEASHPDLGPDPSAARAAARAAGEQLSRHGVTMALAPVADLDAPPAHVMGGRSFGSDPQQVGRAAAAWAAGLQSAGVAATVKHFPGLGHGTRNTDLGVAQVTLDRDELLATDVAAFEPALRVAHAAMLSHATYSALDPHLPASLSPKVLRLLRDELGYDGVAMTDSLNARGLREAWGDTVPSACAQAVRAGNDIALVTGSMETALLCHRAIVRAVREGSIAAGRVEEAALRVVELKDRLGLLPPAAG